MARSVNALMQAWVDSRWSGHLLQIISAAGIKDGAALKQLQGLLDLALKTQD